MNDCRHYYRLDSQNHGVCIFCGEEQKKNLYKVDREEKDDWWWLFPAMFIVFLIIGAFAIDEIFKGG